MVYDPVDESVFEANVVACLLGFQPFVAHDFLSFRLKLTVERKVFDRIRFAGLWAFRDRHGDDLLVAL